MRHDADGEACRANRRCPMRRPRHGDDQEAVITNSITKKTFRPFPRSMWLTHRTVKQHRRGLPADVPKSG
jgi:hypothetical protein